MKEVFTDPALQRAFEQTLEQYEKFRAVVAKQVDCSSPAEIINQMTELTGVMAIGATCKAKFQFLTEKLSFIKAMDLNNTNMGATEKKIVIAYEIGDCSFYNNLAELVIKEAHYKIEILRSSLSLAKQEMNMI